MKSAITSSAVLWIEASLCPSPRAIGLGSFPVSRLPVAWCSSLHSRRSYQCTQTTPGLSLGNRLCVCWSGQCLDKEQARYDIFPLTSADQHCRFKLAGAICQFILLLAINFKNSQENPDCLLYLCQLGSSFRLTVWPGDCLTESQTTDPVQGEPVPPTAAPLCF